jgi:DNA polymerase
MNDILLKKLYEQNKLPNQENIYYITGAKQFVGGHGNYNAKILFIGEAPGKEEEINGIPFCGKSGKLLHSVLEKYNFNEKNIFITNLIKFKLPNNRNPKKKEVLIHSKILIEEINIISPNLIVTVGSHATEFFLQNKNISILHGKIIIKNNIKIFPLFHPAYIMRNKNLLPIFENDIKKLQEITQIHP